MACSGSAPRAAKPAAIPASTSPDPPVASPTPPPLTLSGLFHPDVPFSTDPAHVRTLLATGDVIPSRMVDYYATQKNDFLWPLIVTNSDQIRTLPVGLALLARKNTVNWSDTMAGTVLAAAPMILVFLILQRRFIEGLTAGSVKG